MELKLAMQYVLYAIEVTDLPDGEPPELMQRYDERGLGSPLVWGSREEAESLIKEFSGEEGSHDSHGMSVVELTGFSPVKTPLSPEWPQDGCPVEWRNHCSDNWYPGIFLGWEEKTGLARVVPAKGGEGGVVKREWIRVPQQG